jgi:hypothetical protein
VPDQIPKEMQQIKTNKEAQPGLPYSILALHPRHTTAPLGTYPKHIGQII